MKKPFLLTALMVFLVSCANSSNSNSIDSVASIETIDSSKSSEHNSVNSVDSVLSESLTSIGETNSIGTSNSTATVPSISTGVPSISTGVPSISTGVSTSTVGSSTSTADSSSNTSIPDIPGKTVITVKYNDGKTADKSFQTTSGSVTYGSLGLSNPTRTNYIFMGWFIDNNGNFGKQITPDHPLTTTSNHTVSAKWISNNGFTAPTYDKTYNFENENGYTAGSTVHDYYEKATDIHLLLNGSFIGNGNRNRHNGQYSLRVGKNNFLETKTKIKGLDRLSFYHAPYAPTDNSTVNSTITISYSIDGIIWTVFDTITTTNKNNKNGLLSYNNYGDGNGIGIAFEVYIKIQNGVKAVDNTINIDDLRLMGTRFVGAY